MKADRENKLMQLKARDGWSHQKLEETRKNSPLEPSEGAQPR